MLEDDDSTNSEIRYITIELMKIATQKGVTFEEASREFLKNAVFLKRLIEITESTDQISRVLASRFPIEKEGPGQQLQLKESIPERIPKPRRSKPKPKKQ